MQGASPIRQRMRWIEPGSFAMGSPLDEPGRFDHEGPVHQVTLSRGFWLADTTCSQALWSAVMNGSHPSRSEKPTHPVDGVSWGYVQQFLAAMNENVPNLNLVLPTEAQWEYACRAGTSSPFSVGDQLTTAQANYDGRYPIKGGEKGEYRGKTVPVMRFLPNAWGLFQMHGNVWEWCADGMRTYDETAVTDPLGPMDVRGSRAVRGGSWNYNARDVRSACRYRYDPGYRNGYLSFRCARVQEVEA